MTPQETELLNTFLAQLTQVRGIPKDPDAEALINKAVAAQPDAGYLLVQRALIQDQGIEVAKAQIASLEAEVQRLRAGTAAQPAASSFLGDPYAWGRSAPAAARNGASNEPVMRPAMQPVMQPGASRQMAAPMAQAGRSGPGFLGMAAATAAGVVGGAFLFQGVQNLMNSHNASSGPEQLGGGFDANSQSAALDQSQSMPDSGSMPLDNSGGNDDPGFDTAMDDFGSDSDSFA